MSSKDSLPLPSKIGFIALIIGIVLLGLHLLNAYEILGVYSKLVGGDETRGRIVIGTEMGAGVVAAVMGFVGSKMGSKAKSMGIALGGVAVVVGMVALAMIGPGE